MPIITSHLSSTGLSWRSRSKGLYVSFALSALRKSMLVLTKHQKEALKSVISHKNTFISLLPSHWTSSPSYFSACRIVATTMEECSSLPSVLVVYSLAALPHCNKPCRGTELIRSAIQCFRGARSARHRPSRPTMESDIELAAGEG